MIIPRCRVYRTTNGGNFTGSQFVTWQAESWDTDDMWDGGTPNRITINTPGLYLVQFCSRLSGFTSDPRYSGAYLYRSGAALSRTLMDARSDGGSNIHTGGIIDNVTTPGAYYQLLALHDGTGQETEAPDTYLSATWIGKSI